MERVFVGLLSSAAKDSILMMAHSLLKFIYYALFQQQTDKTLVAMQESLVKDKGFVTRSGSRVRVSAGTGAGCNLGTRRPANYPQAPVWL